MSMLKSFFAVACCSVAIAFMILAGKVEGQESFNLAYPLSSVPIGVNNNTPADFEPPIVFQAAGPNIASIQGAVTEFRNALGDLNGVTAAEFPGGRREINWDGAPPTDVTTPPVNPLNTFLNNRGAQFVTPGTGFSQGPASGGPQGGFATLFDNPTYATEFKAFSNARLFTPVGSNITDTLFFVAGSNGSVAGTVNGFGAIFSDVDQPDGDGPGTKRGNRGSSTLIQFFGVDGRVLFSSFVPASPRNAGFSFLAVKFNDARIARVRITAGDVAPGPNDDAVNDVVMMDDFIYGEPHPAP